MDELDILPPMLIIIMAAAYRQYLRNKRERRAVNKTAALQGSFLLLQF